MQAQASGGTGERQRDEEAEYHMNDEQQGVNRRDGQPKCHLSSGLDWSGCRVRNHVEREQDESGARHGKEWHGQWRAEDHFSNQRLRGKAEEPCQHQRQPTRKFCVNDCSGNQDKRWNQPVS